MLRQSALFLGGLAHAGRVVQQALAQAQGFGSDLQQLVIGQKLQALLQAHLAGRGEPQGVVGAGGAHVGQLLLFADVNRDVLLLGGLAHHHAGIDGHARADEQHTTLLGVVEAVGDALTGLEGHQGAGVAALDLALHGGIGVKDRGHDALALGVGKELVAVAEQAAGGHQELQLHPITHRSHLQKVALAGADLLDDRAYAVAGYVHHQTLQRLAHFAVNLLVEHAGGGDLELVALPAHGLDEDGQAHLAPARHVEGVGGVGLGDPQGHVLHGLAEQPLPDLAGGDELALLAREGGVVDGEGHLDGGGGDLHELDGLHRVGRADGVADGDLADAAHGDDVAGGGLGHRHPAQAIKLIEGGGLGLLRRGVGLVEVAYRDLLVLLYSAPLDAADGDAAHKLVVVNGGDQHLEGGLRVRLRGGDIVEDGLKQGHQVGAGHVGGVGGGALAAGAEQGWGLKLLVGGVQIQQQLQHLVHDLVDALVGAVHLVDHHDDLVAQLQCLAQHKTGLGHGTLGGVHQQDDAVDHLEDPLHLAAKIGVARRVHDVDLHVLVVDGGVLGQNGDAALPLQIVGVHDALHRGLVLAVDAALLEHFVHQGGLAVVDVGDNGDVSQLRILQSGAPLNLFRNLSISLKARPHIIP